MLRLPTLFLLFVLISLLVTLGEGGDVPLFWNNMRHEIDGIQFFSIPDLSDSPYKAFQLPTARSSSISGSKFKPLQAEKDSINLSMAMSQSLKKRKSRDEKGKQSKRLKGSSKLVLPLSNIKHIPTKELDEEDIFDEKEIFYSKKCADKHKVKWVRCTDCDGIAYNFCPMPIDLYYTTPNDILNAIREKFKKYYGDHPRFSKFNKDLTISFWHFNYDSETKEPMEPSQIGMSITGDQIEIEDEYMPTEQECRMIDLVRVDYCTKNSRQRTREQSYNWKLESFPPQVVQQEDEDDDLEFGEKLPLSPI